MGNLEKAIEIAAKAHAGQIDKAGMPYILHPLRMMMKMNTLEEQIAATLHDVVEDTDYKLSDLQKAGFSEEVIYAVECLTHEPDPAKDKNEDYAGFIEQVKKSRIAVNVKIADIEDNMDLCRLNKIDKKAVKRLKRYHAAWLTLKAHNESLK